MSLGVTSLGDARSALVVGGLRTLARLTPWLESELVGVAELIPKGAICIDIGAAAGFYTVELARLVGPTGVVHSVEPLRFAHALASRALGLRSAPNVVRHSVALGASTEEQVMSVPLRNGIPITGRSFVTGRANGLGSNEEFDEHMKVVVDGETLDGFAGRLGLDRLDFVKIDVEGAELDVLSSGRATLDKFKPLVMVEVEDRHLERFGVTSAQIVDWFAKLGYQMTVWDTKHKQWRPVDEVTLEFRNYLFSPAGWTPLSTG